MREVWDAWRSSKALLPLPTVKVTRLGDAQGGAFLGAPVGGDVAGGADGEDAAGWADGHLGLRGVAHAGLLSAPL